MTSIVYTDMHKHNRTVEEANTTTINSKSFVYGTIENGPMMKQATLSIHKRDPLGELTTESVPIISSGNLNEDSAGKDYVESNPYVYKNVKIKSESAMRPHTTEKSKQGQSIIDVYSDGFGPTDQSESSGERGESGTNLLTTNTNDPVT